MWEGLRESARGVEVPGHWHQGKGGNGVPRALLKAAAENRGS